ncbi:MAG: alpha/beta hydrolase [Bacillota bacterium]|nr:alpha/beta hydrolase [Bacillota bacterium]
MKTNKRIFIAVLLMLIFALLMGYQNLSDYLKYKVFYKNNLIIKLSIANPQVEALSCDSQNFLLLLANVRDIYGNPCSNVPLNFNISSNLGKIYPLSYRTDSTGEAVLKYLPPEQLTTSTGFNPTVEISAYIYKSILKSSVVVKLIRPPVIMIHGYQEHTDIFDSMKEFLISKSIECMSLNYKSESGVKYGAEELDLFLQKQKINYLRQGIQVNKFDIIAHSMGGLVVRYYTCSKDYVSKSNVNKIIFVSVPHKGSYWATLGSSLYNDQGIKDLAPDNPLITKVLPGLINNGLNNNIQTGSILGQYDEVVTTESASLDEWNIRTQVFNVGENNLTIDNLLNGNILNASNHKNVLFNNIVFEKIEEMLNEKLPFPLNKTI